ncbi:MAG: site-specific DNA-methyltransferase [Candidatus Accumulibacter sp.]|uniref:site-specific DNA-methyltransferase n=1 Tax=Accumulibacter sp. TaxID=2053492 RepID=UPI0028788C42|nr:site-specific DNA-methyltransferase [Accumulibacter sp.]MDS4013156.1 site-specific DNA-methyltransferase [Accumulibacter sp.]
MTDKKIDSLKHKKAKRVHIPSKEEAGIESNEPSRAQLPLNPVTTRGQDPELCWLEKYGADDQDELLDLDIRSLYRSEHVAPEKLIQRLYQLKRKGAQQDDFFADELFANYKDIDELDKPTWYYKQSGDWANRLIQGDSLMVMGSLLEREGMKGQVQMIYIDPPYGIKYNSNWQIRLSGANARNVKDGDDASLSGEPEVIKAFRDTWELGIHSYLSYLRDRLLVAKELLAESGSCFMQISDENVHLVRCVMDEVFGSENFVSLITVVKTSAQESDFLPSTNDYLVWYGRQKESLKYRKLWSAKADSDPGTMEYNRVELQDGIRRKMTPEESDNWSLLPEGSKPYRQDNIVSQRPPGDFPVEFEGKIYRPITGYWKTGIAGMQKLIGAKRIEQRGRMLSYVRFFNDFPFKPMSNYWPDTRFSSRSEDKSYVVQTSQKVIERCILMTTDPGDLVLDPTCGSGTTAYVAEQWGRRWITTDTSRVALNIAKTRLMTASFPWYTLTDEQAGLAREAWDVRHGFDYKKVQRVTLGSLANDEPPEEVTLFDQPAIDKKKLRVAGPFTVETLQSFEPLAPEALDEASLDTERLEAFQHRVFEHLKSAGVKNGAKNEMAVFVRIDPLTDAYLHAEGYYDTAEGEQKAYIHLGPQFAPVTKPAVNEAIKACRARGDAQWLLILGFAFESDVENSLQNQRAGAFRVDKVRMHDDLLQAGLTKKDKKAATFVTIGEPDIALLRDGDEAASAARIEIRGLDIYDPIKDEVKARSVADIAYWMVDDDYDGASFMVRQVFFCGGDHDDFDKWKKGLSDLAKAKTKKKVENTLKIELDDEAFDRLYGYVSHPIPLRAGRRVAVRVVSQFGEESTKVMALT